MRNRVHFVRQMAKGGVFGGEEKERERGAKVPFKTKRTKGGQMCGTWDGNQTQQSERGGGEPGGREIASPFLHKKKGETHYTNIPTMNKESFGEGNKWPGRISLRAVAGKEGKLTTVRQRKKQRGPKGNGETSGFEGRKQGVGPGRPR